MAWWLRFKEFLLKKKGNPSCGLRLEELNIAERKLLMHVQNQALAKELSALRKLKSAKKRTIGKLDEPSMTAMSCNLGIIAKLCPFIDETGML